MVTDEFLQKQKLHKGNFCGHRFCVMCAWRKAKKDAARISILLQYIEEEQNKEFLFLTLTAPNVEGDKLVNEITKYNRAFKKLVERKEVKQVVKGYIRKLEVTYNENRNDFHAHFHVLIVVNRSYFTGRDYIKQERWLTLWRECMDDDCITQVDVRKLRKNKGKEVLEIATYTAKDEEYLFSQAVFDVFYKALKGRQLITYSGLFSDANKLYEERKLDQYKQKDTTQYMYMVLYSWACSRYSQENIRELTDHEMEIINGRRIDESEID